MKGRGYQEKGSRKGFSVLPLLAFFRIMVLYTLNLIIHAQLSFPDTQDRSEEIIVREGDDPKVVASVFCKKHGKEI